MGELFIHNLNTYIEKYKCNTFIETGTGIGTGLEHACKYSFNKLYSIEIIKELYDKCIIKFKTDARCEILNMHSLNGLTHILQNISKDDRILFWLDAHFPGADFKYGTYEDNIDIDIKLPLEAEIKTIKQYRDIKNDVFIIDDLQLYENGDFQFKYCFDKNKLVNKAIDFNSEFNSTHNIVRDYRHQGFIIITPL